MVNSSQISVSKIKKLDAIQLRNGRIFKVWDTPILMSDHYLLELCDNFNTINKDTEERHIISKTYFPEGNYYTSGRKSEMDIVKILGNTKYVDIPKQNFPLFLKRDYIIKIQRYDLSSDKFSQPTKEKVIDWDYRSDLDSNVKLCVRPIDGDMKLAMEYLYFGNKVNYTTIKTSRIIEVSDENENILWTIESKNIDKSSKKCKKIIADSLFGII